MLTGIDVWKNYAQMMKEAARALLHLHTSATQARVLGQNPSDGKFLSPHGFERDRTFLGLFTSGALRKAAVRYGLFNETRLLDANFVLLLPTATLGLYFALRMRSIPDIFRRVAFVFLLPIDVECFAPVRIAYADVLLALPLILIACRIAIQFIRKCSQWSRPVLMLLVAAFAYAALSRVQARTSVAVFSVARFFITLTTLNAFCS